MENSAHEAIREQASLYVLGGLTIEERAAFEAHRATCPECAEEVQSLKPIVPALAQSVPQFEPAPAVREKLLKRVREIAEATDKSVQRVSEAPKATRSIVPAIQWLPLAASFLIVVGIGAYALQLRGRTSALETELRNALARSDASERQVADARRSSLELQNQMAVLTAPDVSSIDLTGQAAALSAHARAFWSRSRGVVFTATNLPPLAPGRIYQLWFVAADDTRASAGMLSPDAAGAVNLLLTTSPDIQQPKFLAVTNEPAGGSPQPQGTMYLIGQVKS